MAFELSQPRREASQLLLAPHVVHTPGGGIDPASPWVPFGVLLQAASTADISMGNAEPQVNHTPLESHVEGAHEHVSRINWGSFFRPEARLTKAERRRSTRR
jgi:hypothetical protein